MGLQYWSRAGPFISLENLWRAWQQASAGNSFLLVAAGLFAVAIIHGLATARLRAWGMLLETSLGRERYPRLTKVISPTVWHLLSEVECVFMLWALVLLGAMVVWPGHGGGRTWDYLVTGNYFTPKSVGEPSKFIEPLFVLIIMTMAGAASIGRGAEWLILQLARSLGGGLALRWWLILTLIPLLGSLITEPAAMTIAANLLVGNCYLRRPSLALQYATLALLWVNVSLGGALTHFAAPPVIMVAGPWGWGTALIWQHFGVAAVLAILLANTIYYFYFRKEWRTLEVAVPAEDLEVRVAVPWLTLTVRGLLMAATVWFFNQHQVGAMMILMLLELCLSFYVGEGWGWQRWRGPVLVAGFLSGLVILGGLQAWWLEPLLAQMDATTMLLGATGLTAFNDNAAVTYLAAQVPAMAGTSPTAAALRHAVLAGALAGGGLTVMANAPNPAGYAILQPHFAEPISPGRVALWALIPTFLALTCFALF